MFEQFDQFGMDVIVLESAVDEALYGPFDLCPPEHQTYASSRSLALAQK
jgi:hypothetical protein